MIERTDHGPLDELHTAIQAFSNALADDQDDVGVVMAGLVAWEEVSFTDDGTSCRAVHYAAIGDQATPSSSLGLALNLLRTLERDIIGCRCNTDAS